MKTKDLYEIDYYCNFITNIIITNSNYMEESGNVFESINILANCITFGLDIAFALGKIYHSGGNRTVALSVSELYKILMQHHGSSDVLDKIIKSLCNTPLHGEAWKRFLSAEIINFRDDFISKYHSKFGVFPAILMRSEGVDLYGNELFMTKYDAVERTKRWNRGVEVLINRLKEIKPNTYIELVQLIMNYKSMGDLECIFVEGIIRDETRWGKKIEMRFPWDLGNLYVQLIFVTVECFLYKQNRGKFPEKIDKIITSNEERELDDPFSAKGELLKYYLKKVDGEYLPIIYSVGFNGIDEGGGREEEIHDDIAIYMRQ